MTIHVLISPVIPWWSSSFHHQYCDNRPHPSCILYMYIVQCMCTRPCGVTDVFEASYTVVPIPCSSLYVNPH